MPDLDVIVKSLRRCSDMTVCPDDCYYRMYAPDCVEKLHMDAIALLKEQNELLKEQEAKTGHWIEDETGTYTENHDTWECSECHEPFTLIEGTPEENTFYFCPRCGAKMEGR